MRVWVIGGTSGIGQAVVERLVDEGEEDVFATGKEISVTGTRELNNFADRNGPFEALIYSAGINQLDWWHDITPEQMQHMFDVNVTGLVRAIKAAQIGGRLQRVTVVGSDAARRPMRTSLAYCASKAALEMAVKVLAREAADEDFAINLVAPGMTDGTEMTQYIDNRVPAIRAWTPQYAAEYERSQIPMQRRAKPEEIAEVIVKTLLMQTNYLNGATIEVNGGR